MKYFHRNIVLTRYCSDCKNDDDIVKAGELVKGREKRMRDFEEEVKTDAFWSSMSGERGGEQDED